MKIITDAYKKSRKDFAPFLNFRRFLVNYDGMRKAISDPGFESQDHGGPEKANTYVEKSTGKVFTQKEFVDFLKQKFPGLKE